MSKGYTRGQVPDSPRVRKALFTRLLFGIHGNRDLHEGFSCATGSFTLPVTCVVAGEPGRNTQTARPGYRERGKRLPALSRGRPGALAASQQMPATRPRSRTTFCRTLADLSRATGPASFHHGTAHIGRALLSGILPRAPCITADTEILKRTMSMNQKSTIDICSTRISGTCTPLA
jgi:hypothetical protein